MPETRRSCVNKAILKKITGRREWCAKSVLADRWQTMFLHNSQKIPNFDRYPRTTPSVGGPVHTVEFFIVMSLRARGWTSRRARIRFLLQGP